MKFHFMLKVCSLMSSLHNHVYDPGTLLQGIMGVCSSDGEIEGIDVPLQ